MVAVPFILEVFMDLFKRKKVSNQERASNLTLEQLKQQTELKFEEIYNYLDKIAKEINRLS